MTEIRDCWRRDLSLLSPQQRRSAGYALRLLSLPRDPIAGRLDANRLGLLWGMLQPLFEPRHLIDYLRPPQGVADIVHQDDDVVELLNSCDLADCAVEMLDTGDLSDYAPPADAPLTTSDDQVMLALGHALLEEEIMAFEADHDPWVMATMPSVYIVQRLRWLIRRGDPLTLARLDEANLERVPASPTLALLGASLHLDGPTLSVLDFLDEFIATPGLGQLLRRFDDFNSSRRHFPRLAAVLALPKAALRQILAQEAPLRRLGLVEFATQTCGMQDFLRPSPLLREVLEAAPADDAALLALLIEPAPPAAWPLTAFPHLETPARLAGETLAAAVATRAVGVNALLYGPPGTGKTAFAEILAAALDRELVACPAAELLSPWHGETERNLAALFRDGDPRQTVLLLNEVDSFLTARQAARQAWERTQGNELLQQMERYPGIFIAATNLISGLDPAALRRFDFKLHFRALTPAQRRALFAREVLGDDQAAIPGNPGPPPRRPARADAGGLRHGLPSARAAGGGPDAGAVPAAAGGGMADEAGGRAGSRITSPYSCHRCGGGRPGAVRLRLLTNPRWQGIECIHGPGQHPRGQDQPRIGVEDARPASRPVRSLRRTATMVAFTH